MLTLLSYLDYYFLKYFKFVLLIITSLIGLPLLAFSSSFSLLPSLYLLYQPNGAPSQHRHTYRGHGRGTEVCIVYIFIFRLNGICSLCVEQSAEIKKNERMIE